MTTEVPQHPGPLYPPTAYPTAPPWAVASADPPPAYGAVAPYGSPPPQHGQLLVPYPEEMHNAARPKRPAVWPVAPLTFLLVIPGIVSAARRAGQARRGRNGAAPYWITFAVSFVVSWFLWGMIVAVGVPAGLNVYEGRVTQRVEHHIVHDGQIAASSTLTVTTAKCEPTGPRAADDRRAYECLLKLGDGGTGTLNVRAGRDGQWTAVTTKKTKK
jgi:hypothetical protein